MMLLIFLSALICPSIGISISINSRPKETSTIATSIELTTEKNINIKNSSLNTLLSPSERQKRLLPYLNFYVASNRHNVNSSYQKPKRYHLYIPKTAAINTVSYQSYPEYSDPNTYTPFSENNALPGSFVPIVPNQQHSVIRYTTLQKPKSQKGTTDFSDIYQQLWELKSRQQHTPVQVENYQVPPQNPIRNSQPLEHPTRYRVQPTKTVVQVYTPKNIDIPPKQNYQDNYAEQVTVPAISNEPVYIQGIKPYVTKHLVIDLPSKAYAERPKPYNNPLVIIRKPAIGYHAKNIEDQSQKNVVFVQARPRQKYKPQTYPIVEENYVAQKYVSIPKPTYKHPSNNYYGYKTEYRPVTPSPIPSSTHSVYVEHNQIEEDNTNSLNVMLKKLQAANALPQTLTVNNIDNSIRTLVKILNSLKKHRTSLKPIVVADEHEQYTSDENISSEEYTTQHTEILEPVLPEPIPAAVVSTLTDDTQEGGTPGIPGVDYPALSSIPPTSFNCKTQRYKGFFGDPDTNCQVWHYCDLNGGQASFLCPNGTIFSQVALTCDWWYNVKCSSTAQLYVLNERLYKYILPFAPKFPEDYSGPLVDKYLALKFLEMEEKMKKERKGKEQEEEDATATEEMVENSTARYSVKTT